MIKLLLTVTWGEGREEAGSVTLGGSNSQWFLFRGGGVRNVASAFGRYPQIKFA